MDKTKLYKTYNIIIRSAIIIGALWFLYVAFKEKDLLSYERMLADYFQDASFLKIFIIIVLLMPLNWGIEAQKWRYIVESKEEISFWRAAKGVLAGASVSSLSPNRIGDFLGRVFVLKKTNFLQGTFITLIGSYAQTLVSFVFGFLSVSYLLLQHNLWELNDFYLIQILGFLLILVLVFLYYKISVLSQVVPRSWKRIYEYIQIFSTYKYPELSITLAYSILRYFVFSTQFVLLLWATGLHIPVVHLYILVFSIFFLNMIRPSIALVEFAIRGAISITVFRFYGDYIMPSLQFEDAQIFIASTLIWFVNIILPALIGLLFIKDLTFFKNIKKA
jgi:hypothetical protein